jgi:hypothetical protein
MVLMGIRVGIICAHQARRVSKVFCLFKCLMHPYFNIIAFNSLLISTDMFLLQLNHSIDASMYRLAIPRACLGKYFGTRGAQNSSRHSVVVATTFPVEMLRRAGEGPLALRELLAGTTVKVRENRR